MEQLQQLMQKAQETGREQVMFMPAPYGTLLINKKAPINKWTAKPNKQGGIELNYKAVE